MLPIISIIVLVGLVLFSNMTILDRFRLEARVAIVIGSNRGLGKAMALTLAEAGAYEVAIVVI